MSKIIISCEKISKSYPVPNAPDLVILNEVDWEMESGKIVAITGQSGCGKSTFMNILGLLDRQTSGKLTLHDTVFENTRNNQKLAAYRAQKIGFIFQQHYLLPELTALQNVMSAELIRGKTQSVARANAEEILRRLFHEDEIANGVFHRLPEAMSGGQCQRVAIGRALVGNPPLILADEPTGNLDEKTAQQVFELFLRLQKELEISTIMVTHNPLQARQTDCVYRIHDQKITLEKIG